MKAIVTLLLAFSICAITTARPQFPDFGKFLPKADISSHLSAAADLSKYVPAPPDLLKYVPAAPDQSKYVPTAPDLLKYVPASPNLLKFIPTASNEGPNNYAKTQTQVRTGVQSAVNKGSTNSSNKNSAYNVAGKTQVEHHETAQAHGHQPSYHPPPPPPPPFYD